jgi:hypothetical protein
LINAFAFASSDYEIGSSNFDKLTILKSNETLKEAKQALNIVPEKRNISRITFNGWTAFQAYGYSIAIPWDKNLKTLRNDAVSVIYSTNKFLVGLENPKIESWMSEFDENLKKKGLMDCFPDKKLSKEKYSIVSTVLNNTYDDFIKETYLDLAAKKHFLLTIKWNYVAESSRLIANPQPIYSFEINSIRGYQVGSIERTHFIDIYVFTNDNVQLKIIIKRDSENNDFIITQDHIDFIINSIKN